MPGFGPISFKNSDGQLVHLYTGNTREIYVDPNNPDSAGDGSQGNPVLTVDEAVALAVAAGGKSIIKLSPDTHTMGSNINISAPLELIICGGESGGVTPPCSGVDDLVSRLDFDSNQIIADGTGGAVSVELINLTLLSGPADPASAINGGRLVLVGCKASSVPVVVGAGSFVEIDRSIVSSVQNAGDCCSTDSTIPDYTGTSGSDGVLESVFADNLIATSCTLRMHSLSEIQTVLCVESVIFLRTTGVGLFTITDGAGASDAIVKADVVSDVVSTGGTTAARYNFSCARLVNASFAAAGPEAILHVSEEITGAIVLSNKTKIFRPRVRIGATITVSPTGRAYIDAILESGFLLSVAAGGTATVDIDEEPGSTVTEDGAINGRVKKVVGGVKVIVDRDNPGGHFVVNFVFNPGPVPPAPPVRDALGQLNFVYGPGSSEELVANALLEYNRALNDPIRLATMTLNLLLQAPAPGPLAIGVSATELVAGVPIQTTGVIPYAPVIGVAFVPQIVPITISMPGGFTPGSRLSIVVVNLAGPTFDFIDAENVPLFQ